MDSSGDILNQIYLAIFRNHSALWLQLCTLQKYTYLLTHI